MEQKTFYELRNIKNTRKLRQIRSELPKFLDIYFRGIEQTTASGTRIAYATDLKTFFEFIVKSSKKYSEADITLLPLELLNELSAQDIEEYMEYLQLYTDAEGKTITNDKFSIKRKLAAIRSMYQYFHKNLLITNNPCLLVNMPKLREKAIVKLDVDEIAKLLDSVESGENLTKKQKESHKKTKNRDLALMTLMLGTGIRVSECVGLDIQDLDFSNDRIKIIRKGGYESYVYFGDEVRDALLFYLEERKMVEGIIEGNEKALFLSGRKQRLGVRSIEVLVKKYASAVITLKKITPHKLRSTFGTSLYQETNDIYLVADVLGHKDVNITRKHYAALDDEHRRQARNKVTLREK